MFTLWIVGIFIAALIFFVWSGARFVGRKKAIPHRSESSEQSRHVKQSDPDTNEAGNTIPKAG